MLIQIITLIILWMFFRSENIRALRHVCAFSFVCISRCGLTALLRDLMIVSSSHWRSILKIANKEFVVIIIYLIIRWLRPHLNARCLSGRTLISRVVREHLFAAWRLKQVTVSKCSFDDHGLLEFSHVPTCCLIDHNCQINRPNIEYKLFISLPPPHASPSFVRGARNTDKKAAPVWCVMFNQ